MDTYKANNIKIGVNDMTVNDFTTSSIATFLPLMVIFFNWTVFSVLSSPRIFQWKYAFSLLLMT